MLLMYFITYALITGTKSLSSGEALQSGTHPLTDFKPTFSSPKHLFNSLELIILTSSECVQSLVGIIPWSLKLFFLVSDQVIFVMVW